MISNSYRLIAYNSLCRYSTTTSRTRSVPTAACSPLSTLSHVPSCTGRCRTVVACSLGNPATLARRRCLHNRSTSRSRRTRLSRRKSEGGRWRRSDSHKLSRRETEHRAFRKVHITCVFKGTEAVRQIDFIAL